MEKDFQKLLRLGPRSGAKAVVDGRDCKVLATVLREDKPTTEGLLVLYRFCDTEEERLAPVSRWPKTKPAKSDQSGRWSGRPECGTGWKHFKGTTYGVVTNAFLDTTGEHFVIYQADTGDTTRWARTIESWQSPVGGQARFVRVR